MSRGPRTRSYDLVDVSKEEDFQISTRFANYDVKGGAKFGCGDEKLAISAISLRSFGKPT